MSNYKAYIVRTVLCFVAATAGVVLAGCRSNDDDRREPAETRRVDKNDRDERAKARAVNQHKRIVAMFHPDQHKKLIGKTLQDVTSLLGPPDRTELDSDESGFLVYLNPDENRMVSPDAMWLTFTTENGKIINAWVEQYTPPIPDPDPDVPENVIDSQSVVSMGWSESLDDNYGPIQLHFVELPLAEALAYYSLISGKNVEIVRGVDAKISSRSERGLKKREYIQSIENELGKKGIALFSIGPSRMVAAWKKPDTSAVDGLRKGLENMHRDVMLHLANPVVER